MISSLLAHPHAEHEQGGSNEVRNLLADPHARRTPMHTCAGTRDWKYDMRGPLLCDRTKYVYSADHNLKLRQLSNKWRPSLSAAQVTEMNSQIVQDQKKLEEAEARQRHAEEERQLAGKPVFGDADECSICIAPMDDPGSPTRGHASRGYTLGCRHRFHRECLDHIFAQPQTRKECPVCRFAVELPLRPDVCPEAPAPVKRARSKDDEDEDGYFDPCPPPKKPKATVIRFKDGGDYDKSGGDKV